MVGRARTAGLGIIVFVALASPRAARAGVELSARLPVGLAIGDGTRFELGLRSDLLYLFDASNLGLGITGEVRSVSFSQRAQEIGAEVAWLERVGGGVSTGPVLDAGFGTAGTRQYLVGRLSYQLRAGFGTERLDYAAASAIFLGARRSVSGREGTEVIVGVEIGGGLIAAWFRMVQSIVNSG
jgi:hypothetical protein